MNYELTIQIIVTSILVVATIVIAISNYRLTSNIEKLNYGNLMIDFQDKLSDALLLEQEITKKYDEWDVSEVESIFYGPEMFNTIESFMIKYLNLTNAIAYLFTMEKSMLKNHKEYFEFYIAYAEKLLDIKNKITRDDQSKYWQYITPCVEQYAMKSNKIIPASIKQCYSPLD